MELYHFVLGCSRFIHREEHMAKRKLTDIAQMNLRMPEPLRKKIEVEARKNGWSLNRELVRRLEQSFVQDYTAAIIENTGMQIAKQVHELHLGSLDVLIGEFNRINQTLGRSELVLNVKGKTDNG